MVAILARYASRFAVRALDFRVNSSLLWVGAALAVVAAVSSRGGRARLAFGSWADDEPTGSYAFTRTPTLCRRPLRGNRHEFVC
jgi:hypothetical protein